MKRQVVIWICSLLLLGWYTSAHDCGLINTGEITDTSYQKLTENFQGLNVEGIMPAKAISQAMINLRSACCEGQNINKDVFCKWFPIKPYPNSEFFYDQLLDIWFRRLDGNSALAYDLEPDARGKERREFITKAAEDKVGAVTAKTVLEKRNENWTRNKILPDNRTPQEVKSMVLNYNSSQITLADKYYNMCNIVANIYDNLRNDKKIIVDSASASSNKKWFLSKCQTMANNRISDEASYTKIIAIKKSNELLHNTIQAYTQKYFVEEKMMVLLTLLNKVKSLFSTMVQQAPASQSCSQ